MINPRLFGREGTSTKPSPASGAPLRTVILEDGFSMISTDEMYRMDELDVERRAPKYDNLHNLSESVIDRTLNPPPVTGDIPTRRAEIWDVAAKATREALCLLPTGSHINICANSGSCVPEFEKLSPWTKVRGAAFGLLYVAEFREEDAIHPAWIQIAAPINHDEGRLLAGLRLLPIVVGRADLTFHVTNLTNHNVAEESFNLVRDHPLLTWGCVINSYRPTNLGCTFFHGLRFADEAPIFRASFAWDGDLYGWDEAVLSTRNPVVVVTNARPERRFQYWRPTETFSRGIYWYRMVDGQLNGGFQATTTRADLVNWDLEGKFPGGPLQ